MPLQFLSSPFKKTVPNVVSQLYWRKMNVEVSRKVMKSMRLKLTKNGELRISCPHFVQDHEILTFLEERHDWIQKHQIRLKEQQLNQVKPTSPRHFILWGEEQLITEFANISEQMLSTFTNADSDNLKQQIMREQLKIFIDDALPEWQSKMQVQVQFWNVRKMKTKWGSCNINRQRIWLNTHLASFPKSCAEMVLVHELAHLIEASHNKRFYQIMDTYLPTWREADELLKTQGLSL